MQRSVNKVIMYDSYEILTKYLNIMIGVEQRGDMKQLWGYIPLCVHDLLFKKRCVVPKRKDYDANITCLTVSIKLSRRNGFERTLIIPCSL